MTPFIGPDELLNLQLAHDTVAQKRFADVFAAVAVESNADNYLADDDSLAAFGMPSEAAGFYRSWLAAGRDGNIGTLLETIVDNGGDVHAINSPEDAKVWKETYEGFFSQPYEDSFTTTVVRNVMHFGNPCVAMKAAAGNNGAGNISKSDLEAILAAGGMDAAAVPLQSGALDANGDGFVTAEEVTIVMGVVGDYCQPLSTTGKLAVCSGIGEQIASWIDVVNDAGSFPTTTTIDALGSDVCAPYTAIASAATQDVGCGAPPAEDGQADAGASINKAWGIIVAVAAATITF